MLKTLLNIDENLASSIAIRFTDYLSKFTPLSLYVTHVEEPEDNEQVGTGWVRRTWEDGIAASGKRLVDRMLRTENISCPLAGRPKVFVGDRDKEITYELRNGLFNLFIEGFLNNEDPDQLFELLSSPLYTDMPCSTLLVKNLSISKKCALLCTDSVDPKILVEKSMAILGDSTFSFDIVYFKFSENENMITLDRSDGGSLLQETESLLVNAEKSVENVTVLSGTPEQVGEYLKDYALMVSTLPKRKSMWMDVLANSLTSVLLVH